MENDIDDLLDEVEQKFVKKTTISPKVKAKPKLKSGLDADINDILDLDVDATDNKSSAQTRQSDSKCSLSVESHCNTDKKRCFPVYLGGSNDVMGRGASINKHACDRLRCTSCDFRICSFDNMAWSKDTDYLFLRNNTPDFEKLKAKLHRKKGCRAYCCQCQWRNISVLSELIDPQLKWVCGKHVS